MDDHITLPPLYFSFNRISHFSSHHGKKTQVSYKLSQDKMCQAIARELMWSLATANTNRQNATLVRFHRRWTDLEKAAETNEKDSKLSRTKGVLETIRNFQERYLEAMKETLKAIAEAQPKWKWVSTISPALVLALKQWFASNRQEPREVSFTDLVGLDKVKSELDPVLSMLQGKKEYKGVYLPEGLLLYGPPRAGKTTLVHALAREANVPFFPVSAKDLAKKDSEDGAISIKELFTEAKGHSASIIYIKDIDVIASKGANESHPILDKLRTEMDKCYDDGYGRMVAVIVATSTIIDVNELNPKLMTPGRFNIRVHVDKPDENSRQEMAGLYLKHFLQDEEKEEICKAFAAQTHGLVGADIKSISNTAKCIARQRGATYVTMDDLRQALAKVLPNVENNEPVAEAANDENEPVTVAANVENEAANVENEPLAVAANAENETVAVAAGPWNLLVGAEPWNPIDKSNGSESQNIYL